MEIVQEKINGNIILQLKGRFDAGTSTGLENGIIPLIVDDLKGMAIDFSELDYINSSGLRVVLMAAKKINKVGGKMVLFSMKEHIKEVFDMTGFSSIIPVVGSRDEALKSL